jgi:hypothetical protein
MTAKKAAAKKPAAKKAAPKKGTTTSASMPSTHPGVVTNEEAIAAIPETPANSGDTDHPDTPSLPETDIAPSEKLHVGMQTPSLPDDAPKAKKVKEDKDPKPDKDGVTTFPDGHQTLTSKHGDTTEITEIRGIQHHPTPPEPVKPETVTRVADGATETVEVVPAPVVGTDVAAAHGITTD